LGLGLDGMVLVLRLKSCNFQDQRRTEMPAMIEHVPVTELMHSYLAYIQSIAHGHEIGIPWNLVKSRSQLSQLMPLLEHVFCGPCTSAPVERVFSHSGIFVRPHRASLSDRVLCDLMMSKCNSAF
jgi:hAT family C-terminal dimerisation region